VNGDSGLNGHPPLQVNAVVVQVVGKGIRAIRNGTELFARHGLGTVHELGNSAEHLVRAILLQQLDEALPPHIAGSDLPVQVAHQDVGNAHVFLQNGMQCAVRLAALIKF
jgi:hypothetical protein